MIIKKFQGATEMEAVLQAKEELGKDAVVLNVKTIKQRGLFKLFKPTSVEVTVALEEVKVENKKIEEQGMKAAEKKGSFNSVVDEKINISNLSKKNNFEKNDWDDTSEIEKNYQIYKIY